MTRPKTLRIAPVKGRSLPLEGSARRHLTEEREVPNTLYYRRAIRRGDVVEVTSKTKAKAEKSDS